MERILGRNPEYTRRLNPYKKKATIALSSPNLAILRGYYRRRIVRGKGLMTRVGREREEGGRDPLPAALPASLFARLLASPRLAVSPRSETEDDLRP